MKTYLITGARSLAALEIARNLKRNGNQVYLADSWSFPISRGSRYIDCYYKVRKPRFNPTDFQTDIINIVNKHNIDFIIPTCEETFYLSQFRDKLPNNCTLFCDDIQLLAQLHHKLNVMQLVRGCHINLPESYSLAKIDLNQFEKNIKEYLVKPFYSRFGSSVYFDLSLKLLRKLEKSNKGMLLQQKIKGIEYCTYSIAIQGKLLYHVTYHPSYRLTGSASFYFTPVQNSKIKRFVEKFVAKHNYNGQIGFDIIENENGIYLIECNPRANSGVHFTKQINLSNIFNGIESKYDSSVNPIMLKYAMLTSGFVSALFKGKFKQWLHSVRKADEAAYENTDGKLIYYQCLSFAELFYLMLRYKRGMRDASTIDMQWSGDVQF